MNSFDRAGNVKVTSLKTIKINIMKLNKVDITLFKDVAHLYIGCETTQGKLLEIRRYGECYTEKNNELFKTHINLLKPLLRSMEQITIGEIKYMEEIKDKYFTLPNSLYYAKFVEYCLKRKIDIFQLIENKQSINILKF